MDVLTNPAVWYTSIGALIFAVLLTPLVIRLAHRMDWLAYPKADRWHSKPTALMGGIGIYAAATLAVLLFGLSLIPWPIWLGASIMFATGLIDDLIEIRPTAKMLAQIGATALLIYSGYVFGPNWPFWISIPLTFLWIVGVTNALNLLDNMDGLASGIAAIAAIVLAVYSAFVGDVGAMLVAGVIAGAAIGYLVYNFKPAKIFMGDSGSLFLGYSIAALAVVIQNGVIPSEAFGVYLVSAAVLAIPIFDTTLVTVMRKASGRAISQGGRDHSSHRLVFLGLSERAAVLTLYALSALFGGISLLFLSTPLLLFYSLLALTACGLIILGVYLGRANVYDFAEGDEGLRLQRRIPALLRDLMGRQWKALFGVVIDLMVVGAVFIVAFYLRFETGITPEREMILVRALPVVMAVKVVTFFFSGLYRGIWRHAGTPEIVRIAKASLIASIGAYVAVGAIMGFAPLSKGVFVIDFMATLLAIMAVRLGFRGLSQIFASQRQNGRRVLLYGAGEGGQLALRELRQNPRLELLAVGFLDDDPLIHGQVTQGLKVLGGIDALEEVHRNGEVDEVLVTSMTMPAARREEIIEICDDLGLPCRKFRLSFEDLYLEEVGGDSSNVSVSM